MNKLGPIVVIEDDADDRLILGMIFEDLAYKNEIAFFKDGAEALEYLQDDNVYPFIIISDINLPRLNALSCARWSIPMKG